MAEPFDLLAWDSEFFGYSVARINVNHLNTVVINQLSKADIKLAYFNTPSENISFKDARYEIKLVDQKVFYFKKIEKSKLSPNISVYDKDYPTDELIKLAIRSGKYSRFKKDEKIGNENFERLYTHWIIASINKKIAKEVLVYKIDHKIVGFITIGEKKERTDVGIIAVDEKYTGRGIGKELMESAENFSGKNYKSIQVITQFDNIAAVKLYESCGYKLEGSEFIYHLWKNNNYK